MTNDQLKKRTTVPADVEREVLIDCGFKCPVPRCNGQWPTLHLHHIDGNPNNHDPANILPLCPTHHQMVTSGNIDRKACKRIKEFLSDFSRFPVPPDVNRRARLLYTLMAETLLNRQVLDSKEFLLSDEPLDVPVWYHRLQSYVLREARSSGLFNTESDRPLFSLMSHVLEVVDQFNQRLSVAEFIMFGPFSRPNTREQWRRAMGDSARDSVRERIVALGDLLVARYGEEGCFGSSTQFCEAWPFVEDCSPGEEKQ